MDCWPSSLTLALERTFNRIRCVLTCCGGHVPLFKTQNFAMIKALSSTFLDPNQPASFVMYQAVKEKGKNKVSRKQVQNWLSQQDVYTLHKSARRYYKRSRVIVLVLLHNFKQI